MTCAGQAPRLPLHTRLTNKTPGLKLTFNCRCAQDRFNRCWRVHNCFYFRPSSQDRHLAQIEAELKLFIPKSVRNLTRQWQAPFEFQCNSGGVGICTMRHSEKAETLQCFESTHNTSTPARCCFLVRGPVSSPSYDGAL